MEDAVCHFVFYTGPRKGEAEAFTTARISIGRANNCDFRVEAFQLDQVAPHHAEVLLEEGQTYCLYDLGTKSGTFVNGERVNERCVLMSEDYIRFGEEGPEVIFRMGQPQPGKQSLPDIFPVSAELEFFSGSDAGRIFPVNAATTTNIGRRADLEVPLDPRGDMIVSGNHCNIRYVNGHFVLTDTSRNGTYVNGELVDQPLEILDADVIMLGDGGPQARFHMDQAGRRYPNHRALSRTAKSAESASTSSFKPSASAPETLASAKPFASGTASLVKPPEAPPVDAELSEEAEEVNEEVAEVVVQDSADDPVEPVGEAADAEAAYTPAAANTAVSPDEDVIAAKTDDMPAATAATDETAATAPKPKRQMPDLPFTRKQMMIAGGILAALVLVIIISTLASEGGSENAGAAGRGNYAEALQNLERVENPDAAFAVSVPAGWSKLVQGNFISIESPDKAVAVDYVRDERASEANLQALLAKNGAEVGNRGQQTVDGRAVVIMESTRDDLKRAGSLILTEDVPVMVVMEATDAAMNKLSEEDRNRILAANVQITGPLQVTAPPQQELPAPVVTPPPAPEPQVAGAPAPTPDAGSSAVPEPPAASTGEITPAPAAVSPTPAATVSAESEEAPATVIASESLNINLKAPAGWTGASEEEDQMIMLTDGAGVVVRIARDPGDLDADATFEAMEEDEENDWTRLDVQKGPNFTAGEFRNNQQNLLLILIPEAEKTTLLIYCTSSDEFSREQRMAIKDIMVQLLPQ